MKPFVKWAGGKARILSQLEANLPANFNELNDVTYVEPFVGGGAMLFHLLNRYPNITSAFINDINSELVNSYKATKENPQELFFYIKAFVNEYLKFDTQVWRETQYYAFRSLFNSREIDGLERTALFLFLNRTCFNGLYRVNKKGEFNVPHGRYKRPLFLSLDAILRVSETLQKVNIFSMDFQGILNQIHNYRNLFVYIDPPYRPISKEKNIFTQYDSSGFGDLDQERVKALCDEIHGHNGHFMVSNSDSYTESGSYFEQLFNEYQLKRIDVTRLINTYNAKDLKATEIIITNY